MSYEQEGAPFRVLNDINFEMNGGDKLQSFLPARERQRSFSY